MKLKIILDNGHDCELGSHVIEVHEDDAGDVITAAVAKLLAHSWTLAPGDTIRIVEVAG